MEKDVQSKKSPPEECRSESELDDEFYETLVGPIRALALVGLKPFYFVEPRGPIEYLREYWWIFVSLWWMTTMDILEVGYLLFNENKTFVDKCANISFLFYGLSSGIKMYILFFKRKKYHRLFVELHAAWPKNVEGEALQLKLDCTRQIRFITPNYVSMTLMMVSFFWLCPLIFGAVDYYNEGECVLRYPFYVIEPFSVEKPVVYKLYFMFTCWAGYSAAASSCAMDSVFQVVSTHVGMQYKILTHDLINLVRDEDAYSEFGNRDETDVIERFNALVEKHNTLIRIVEILEDLYAVPNGLTVGSCTIVICCAGYVTTAAAESTKELIQFSFGVITFLTQALLFSFHGHQIIEESDQLVDSIYKSRWYNAGPRLRKSLIIMMSRCQTPTYVTNMKFAPVSLNTFTQIVGKSWSIYTLLRTAFE